MSIKYKAVLPCKLHPNGQPGGGEEEAHHDGARARPAAARRPALRPVPAQLRGKVGLASPVQPGVAAVAGEGLNNDNVLVLQTINR